MSRRQIYYVTLTYANKSTNVRRITAMDPANATMRAIRETICNRKDLLYTNVSEPIPYDVHERQKKLNRINGAKARHKREREEKIMVTRGTESLGSLYEYEQSKKKDENSC